MTGEVNYQRKEVIGDCTLILGDALEVLPTLGKVDAVVTSPPYAQQRDYGAKITDWDALMCGVFGAIPHHEKTQLLVNLGPIHRDGEVVPYWEPWRDWMRGQGWRFFGWYVWDQLSGMAGDWSGRLAPSYEFVLHFNKTARAVHKTKPTKGGRLHSGNMRNRDGSTKLKTHDGKPVQPWKIPDNVIRCVRETSGGWQAEHPARFPVQFASELIAPFTDGSETVVDPFLGSGTTLVSCAKLGRKGIGIEKEPKYFDIACKRVEAVYREPRLSLPEPVQPKQEVMEL